MTSYVTGKLSISIEALRRNARALAAHVAPSRLALVVKANAYGHGLVETALAVESIASALCVYNADEAIALRDGGITAPILILGPIPHDALDDVSAAGAEIALWDMGAFTRDAVRVARARLAPFRAHVKINTGLNRLGLAAQNLADAIDDYVRLPELQISGVFSHLASAEEIDSPYTQYQLEQFHDAMRQTEPMFSRHGLRPARHLAASAAAMLWPQMRLDMVRAGIALYGLWPSSQTREAMEGSSLTLEPALTYTSSLAVVRTVAAGAAIGYGCTFHAPREMRIGVVPLGYSDGIPRLLSNTGAFAIDGVRVPIIGRIAMNMTIIDVTHAPHAHPGTEVTLIGPGVSADDWAAWAQTISHEIVTRLPAGLPRVYTAPPDETPVALPTLNAM